MERQEFTSIYPLYDLKCPKCGSKQIWFDDEFWWENMVEVDYEVTCEDCKHRFTVKALITIYEIVNHNSESP